MPEPTKKLKVCHVFGGVEGGRWVFDQLQALRDDHGFEVVAALGGEEGPTVDLFRKAGIRFRAFSFSFLGRGSFFMIPWRILQLAMWMRRERVDVVQSHVISSTLFARPAAWLADVPVRLVMVTGPYHMQAPATRRMEKSTAWMETGIIPSCNLTGELYRTAGISERLVLPTLYYGPRGDRFDPAKTAPAGLREELGLPKTTPLIGCVAYFYPRQPPSDFIPREAQNVHVKGQADLIRAMRSVCREFPDAKLLLIGKGWGANGPETERELRELVAAEALDDCVIFTGFRRDVDRLYMDLDVSVQASLNDNLGGTVESLLMACPTVATRVGGMVDSVIDGKTGLLANPGDPEDLARAIVEMLRDRERARRLGQAGREWMLERFTLDTTVNELATLYRRQRGVAQGAWRLRAGIGRFFLAALLHAPILGRALLVDLYLKATVRARFWSYAGRIAALVQRGSDLVRRARRI